MRQGYLVYREDSMILLSMTPVLVTIEETERERDRERALYSYYIVGN